MNLEFIRRYGLGWVALTAPEHRELVHSLATDQARLGAMRGTVNKYRAWNTAATEGIRGLTEMLVGKG